MYYLHLIFLLAVLSCLEARFLSNTAKTCIDSSFRAGMCKTVENCPGTMDYYYDDYTYDYQTFISHSICGWDGRNILICCITPTSLHQRIPQPPQFVKNEFDDTMNHPLQQVDQSHPFQFSPLGGSKPSKSHKTTVIFSPTPPTKGQKFIPQTTARPYVVSGITQRPSNSPNRPRTCGLLSGTTDRVVGGSEARRGNYPWIAALMYGKPHNSRSLRFRCGGSLISPKYVLTAAHCVRKDLTMVRLGAHDITNMNEINARNYRIKRTKMHENFNSEYLKNDVALIELASPVVMTGFINTICLPDDPNFFVDEFVGMRPFVAGWGAKKHLGPTSKVLRDAQVPIIELRKCEKNYRQFLGYGKFDKTVICAGNSSADACQGDSGGPLMLPKELDNSLHYYLLGVVSFGYKCSRDEYPGVYTRVAAYMPWIKKNMR